jgi:tRNA (guanine26-N2/guanine27-N2)-dimethyltransferase
MTSALTHRVKEGTTEFFVVNNKSSTKGPSSRGNDPFYNPAMELNRDVSILVNQWFLNRQTRHVHLLDGLAASGARGIRFAHELSGDFEVSINDWNDQSCLLIQQNIQSNSLQNISVFQRDLNSLLSECRFNSIDIDPFGSPVYFFNAAMRSVYNRGIIACTATDVAALCGVFPRVCYRRYAAWPLHVPCMHEIGLRILLGCLCRNAAMYDRGIEPLLCYATDHYLRVYVQVRNGKSAANRAMAQFHGIMSDEVPHAQNSSDTVGPIWLGRLQNTELLQELRMILSEKQLNTSVQLKKLLLLLEAEADSPAFFYTTNDLSSTLKQSPPPIDHLFELLRHKGFVVTRTHCTPTGFKTNAPLSVIKEVFK